MPRRAILLALVAAALPAPAGAAVELVEVGHFSSPVYVTAPPGDSHRLFVVEQTGRIRLIAGRHRQARPFLDISREVTSRDEQGLLSMAFAPDYARSGRFFVYYTSRRCPNPPGCDEHVSEFRRSAANPNLAAPRSERVLLDIPHPDEANHNGGQLQFGPDGYLYISTGDGGGENDSEGNAQRRDDLLGKILRIDPSRGRPYAIPRGNPFGGGRLCSAGSNGGSTCPEIWAYGLRNPWRFSFDRVTGDLVIADVGEHAWEEIDLARGGQNAGADYGWPCFEGTADNSANNPSECSPLPSPVVMPVWTYSHDCDVTPFCGAGIIGGYVVRDRSLRDLYGRYVYGDLSGSGHEGLRSLLLGQPSATGERALPLNVPTLSSFGEDAAGCVYAMSVGDGGVWRLAPSAHRTPGPCRLALALALSHRQRILRTHAIELAVVANERSTLTATAAVSRAGPALRFPRVRRVLAASRHATVRLRLPKSSFAGLRRALRHRRSLLAHVTLSARDAAGERAARRVAVRLVR